MQSKNRNYTLIFILELQENTNTIKYKNNII